MNALNGVRILWHEKVEMDLASVTVRSLSSGYFNGRIGMELK
jgi:hypothetical protein